MTNKVNWRYAASWCKPCICGSKYINLDNTNGWSEKGITCKKCRRNVKATSIKEAVAIWNKEYNEKYPDKFEE